MRYGARPTAEWKHKAEAEAPPRRQKWSRDPRVSEPWPMPWVGRLADSHEDTQVYEWDEFLNKLGRDNRRLGKARAMGSVAVTYFEGTTLQQMLQERFDKYNSSRKNALELQRRFSNNIRGFLQQREYEAVQQSSQTIALQRQKLMRYEINDDGREVPIDSGSRLTFAEETELERTRFSTSRLAVTGLSLYGKNKLGIDLTQNEILYQERNEVVGYLRSEGFNTNRIDRDWEPHAVIFDMHDHISSRTQIIKYKEDSHPTEAVFFRPNTDFSQTEV